MTGQFEPNPAEPEQPRSLGAIVADISRDLGQLVHQEMDLAKTELKQELARTGKGAGMLGGAGIAGLMALLFLTLALVYLIDNWMPIELGALIAGLLWAAAAAALGARGRSEVKQAHPELPQTQRTLKEDVQWAKAQKS